MYNQKSHEQGEQSQTLSFRDGSEQWDASFNDQYDSTRDLTYHEDVPLSQFFARPVKIASYNWGTADVTPFFQSFDPWTLFLSNPRVSNRISNFQNFSGKLHVKFVINGNSFYYGRLMADYFPLRNYDTVSQTDGSTGNAAANLMQASQRLHLYIDPCESQAGELELPFIWFYDKVNLSLGEYANLGTVYIRQLEALKHANGATGTINITTFIWATDVKLSIPTVRDIPTITAQGGKFDEYGTGIVSGVASAVAAAAGKLSKVPYIGKYAKATEMISSTMGKVAQMFGFSRPAVIADYVDMKPSYVSRMANTNVGDNVAKLSVDAKQELTIDPSVVGLNGTDEMAINALARKESYFTQFPWTVARVQGDLLFTTRVGPIWDYITAFGNLYYLTAMAYTTFPFKYWRGSVIYRFQIVASGYHKGRLLLVWDPSYQATGAETNVQYSKIIDLSDERDFTFEVGWGSNTSWLTTPTLSATPPFRNGPAYGGTSSAFNGVVSVYVLNELTTPNSTANNDIRVNCFVRACEDWEVAVPTDDTISKLAVSTALTPQSGTFEEVAVENKNAPQQEETKETIAMCVPQVDHSDLVYMGEKISSLRQIIKRYNLWGSLGYVVLPTAVPGVLRLGMPDFPPNRGYSLYGAVLKTANYYNPTYTTLLNYLSVAFMAYRGGVRWKAIMNSSDLTSNTNAVVSRLSTLGNYTSPYLSKVDDVVSTAVAFSANRVNSQLESAQNASHATITRQMPVLEFETPFYQNYRFASPRNLGGKAAFAADLPCHVITASIPASATASFDLYVAGAEDSTFVGFQGAPPLLLTTTI